MQPLGTWKNAPLAYVVAEVRFGSLLSLDSIAGRLQESLVSQFPRLIKGQAVALNFGAQVMTPQVVPRFHFLSEDGRTGVVLGHDTLAVHATTYIDSAHFAQVLREVWGAWLHAWPKTFVERLGMRYWDIVLPEGGLSVGDFFAAPFSGIETLWPGGRLSRHTHELVYEVAGPITQSTVVRAGTVPAAQPYPPAFFFVPELSPSERLQRATALAQREKHATIAFLDVDASAEIKRIVDADTFVDCAKILHQSQSAVFKALTSERGQTIWKDGVSDA
ncbi:TIGR04255 family protein [Paraburkholderia diazotrophica]|uniref:TIGR04255 family protein n=1 Tax=Paraburkholderia diazotrophica TaxID=667676 RepID=UPI00316B771C